MNNNEAYKPNIEKDTSLSDIIMITKPNKEIAIGFKASEQNDNYNNNDSSDIKLYEKNITIQHYGTIDIPSSIIQNNLPLRSYTLREYNDIIIHDILLKYLALILVIFIVICDIKALHFRILNLDNIVADLRIIHIQMDDVQLYQILWSFIIVYLISLGAFGAFSSAALAAEEYTMIQMMIRATMFMVIYEVVEIVLRQYDIVILFMRIVLVMIGKLWLRTKEEIEMVMMMHPEYRNYSIRRNN